PERRAPAAAGAPAAPPHPSAGGVFTLSPPTPPPPAAASWGGRGPAPATPPPHGVPPAGNAFAAGDLQDIVVANANLAVGQITLATARLVSGTVLLPPSGGAANGGLKFVNLATAHRAVLTKTPTKPPRPGRRRRPPGPWGA